MTPDKLREWQSRRVEVRQAFLHCLGDMPERCPLDAETMRTASSGNWHAEWIRFRAEADEWVTAVLVKPDGVSCPPVVVALHGYGESKDIIFDELDAKGEGSSLILHECMASGIALLAPDARCHSDRLAADAPVRVTENEGWMKRFETEWQWLARRALIYGSSLQGLLIHDVCRSIDYLDNRDDVDSGRVGVFGHSLGGTTAWSTTVVDERIKVAAVSGCLLTYETALRIRRDASWHCWIPGLRKYTGRGELVSTIAPRPLLAIHGNNDFPREGIDPILEAVSSTYRLHGSSEKFKSVFLPCGHVELGKNQQLFRRVGRWFLEFL